VRPLGQAAQRRELVLQRLPRDLAQPARDVVLRADGGELLDGLEEGREMRPDVRVAIEAEGLFFDRRPDVRQPARRDLVEGRTGNRCGLALPGCPAPGYDSFVDTSGRGLRRADISWFLRGRLRALRFPPPTFPRARKGRRPRAAPRDAGSGSIRRSRRLGVIPP